ncbi:hypothetical protein Q4601_15540 [Shewanella sp. 1_MG-2023]|uniref:hypothetical protein n=2 Tax=Shewanella TaxID=22 RepID=UPI0026E47954|nr:hypothetical protein [Shewanella sp. 2_MG-2023]MDO6613072.1 hypothetical protein [Shewanella sp. 7_MG-2023]MDO6772940.1 hypothetical protein [Shewanella sp. 2_MG-2023]MDO6795720.1 hypothetical protein [Shewanella sp. 1_MG-2023]
MMNGYGGNLNSSSDAIINEIKDVVLALDYERYGIKRNRLPPLGIDYLDILDDVTKLERQEIENIAKEVISKHKNPQTLSMSPQQRRQIEQQEIWQRQEHRSFSSFMKDFSKGFSIYKLLIASSLLIIFAVLVHMMTNDLRVKLVNQELVNENQQKQAVFEQQKAVMLENVQKQIEEHNINSQHFFEDNNKKWLFQSLTRELSSAGKSINDFYRQHQRLPKSNKEVRKVIDNLEEQIGIKEAFISNKQGIAIVLDFEFAAGTVVHLTPTESGYGIHWRCETNADKALLQNPTQHICAHNYKTKRMSLLPSVWAD